MARTMKLLLLTLSSLSLSSGDLDTEVSSKILSRQKRYLIFPDGSSFQLVICEQNHGYLQIGDIVWFGNTAALAWELPNDPKYFHVLKGHEKEFFANRNGVSKHIYLVDERGKVMSKIPYHKKFIVNPAFAKRSIEQTSDTNDFPASIRNMHERRKNDSLEHLDPTSIEFHRDGRKDFYKKFQSFLDAMGLNGQECVLRMLCETGQGTSEQGTFFEEIMRATFTFPSSKTSSHHLYDSAHRTKKDCQMLYPACDVSE